MSNMKTHDVLKNAVLVLVFLINTTMHAQKIDSMVVVPSSPIGVNDTIKIYVYNSFTSGACAGAAYYSISGFNVMASALHCQGALTVICTDIDTIIINPPHAIGNYRVSFVLNAGFGGPPCTPGIVPNDFDTTYFTVGTNLAPVISAISDDTTCKNMNSGPLAFTLSDEDIGSLVINASSDNQTLVANSNINFAGSGSNRTVTVTPTANQLGIANIKIVVEDNKSLRDSIVFGVYVKECTVGISKATNMDLELYPNPSDGKVTIDFGRKHSKVNLSLSNISGQVINYWTYKQVDELELNLGVKAGVYVLKISTNQDEAVFRLLVE